MENEERETLEAEEIMSVWGRGELKGSSEERVGGHAGACWERQLGEWRGVGLCR